jgi:hypothetical protein
MMSEQPGTASKPDYNVIPVQLSAEEFKNLSCRICLGLRRLAKITWSIISIEVKLYSSTHHEICVS